MTMSGAPLPLLGTFHELSLAVDDVPAAVEFFERLGFTQASTSDTYTHAYGVLTDGRLYVGVDVGLTDGNDHGPASTSPYLYDILTFRANGTGLHACASSTNDWENTAWRRACSIAPAR